MKQCAHGEDAPRQMPESHFRHVSTNSESKSCMTRSFMCSQTVTNLIRWETRPTDCIVWPLTEATFGLSATASSPALQRRSGEPQLPAKPLRPRCMSDLTAEGHAHEMAGNARDSAKGPLEPKWSGGKIDVLLSRQCEKPKPNLPPTTDHLQLLRTTQYPLLTTY